MSPQGGGGGSGTAAGVFDSSLKGGGQVGRNGTLTPVTIKELRDAAQTSPEESTFQICGTPLAQVAIVGVILRVEQKSTNTLYTLDDGTAQMDVMFWTTGEESEHQIKKKEMWAEGKYVKAIGTLRVFQGKRNIAANTICLVKDPNQIIFHQLQAISVYNEFSKASGSQGSGDMGAAVSTAMGASPIKPPNVASTVDSGLDLNAVQQAVCNAIGASQNEQGCNINDIRQALAGKFDTAQIPNVLDYLSSEGHIYPTIDDDHYQLCSN